MLIRTRLAPYCSGPRPQGKKKTLCQETFTIQSRGNGDDCPARRLAPLTGRPIGGYHHHMTERPSHDSRQPLPRRGHRDTDRTQKVLFVSAAIVVGFWLLSWGMFHAFGRCLITAAYERTLPLDFLNHVIQGQQTHELSHYLAHAGDVFRRLSVLLIVLAVILVSIGATVAVPVQRLKKVLVILALNMLVLFIADRAIGRLLGAPRERGRTFSERVIRLKKPSPHLDEVHRPSLAYLAETDGLTADDFRLRTDSRGFIMPTDRHRDPDLRVFFVGGSTTECLFVHEDHRFPIAAARRLEERTGLKINAYNAGVGGNNSLHSINIVLNDVLPLEPDVIAFMHNINDLVILLYTGTYWNENASRSPIRQITLQVEPPPSFRRIVSEAARWIAPHAYGIVRQAVCPPAPEVDEWGNIRGQMRNWDRDGIRREFTSNLRSFVALCRYREVVPVLMTQQNRFTSPPDVYIARSMHRMETGFGIAYADYYDLYVMMNDLIRSVAAEQDVPLIDLDRSIPKSREFMYDSVHFNDQGSLLAAQVIAESLQGLCEVRVRRKTAGERPRAEPPQ
mgnify:FL=1